jgi:hypothetical protein
MTAMHALRKTVILTHRYLGILLGALFVIWFASGIGMMYAGGMPQLSGNLRLIRLSELDLSSVHLTPGEAAVAAGLSSPATRVTLLNVAGRPAYRMGGRRSETVFADDGTYLTGIDVAEALQIASRFMTVPPDQVRYESLITEPDQWTLSIRGGLPFHKIAISDPSHTELYVSPSTGEIEMLTTRSSRALAWVAAIPHWLYFTPLRANQQLWTSTILWTAGLGCLLALFGIVLGVWQFRFARPFRLSRCIPYAGWMRWHYITGLVFGVFTLTWVFSGLLSMEPFGWAAGEGLSGAPLQRALSGPSLDLAEYPIVDASTWGHLTRDLELKEVEYSRIQGDPYFVVRGVTRQHPRATRRLLVDATTLEVRQERFTTDSLMARVRESYPNVAILESALLSEYDAYYYDRDMAAPLPILRVKFDDPDQTWFYIDPTTSRFSGSVHKLDRIERWIYNGFHSLDFGFWYYNRPLWDIGVIILSLGGLATSGIGLYLGLRRLSRGGRALVS